MKWLVYKGFTTFFKTNLNYQTIKRIPSLFIRTVLVLLILQVYFCCSVFAHNIVEVVAKNKSSVVGVGLYDALGAQSHQLRGSGFVVGNGQYIATNHHVVSQTLNPEVVQYWVVFSGQGRTPHTHRAEIVGLDPIHDLAILKIDSQLEPLKLAAPQIEPDGTEILLTGFPIGAVLGLYPATHRGLIAATTPDALPSASSEGLSSNLLNRLKDPFLIYQLDITAFPGNSGSAVYRAEDGKVVGVLNKVFVSQGKESVLENPSGISYAIPIEHLFSLAKRNKINL